MKNIQLIDDNRVSLYKQRQRKSMGAITNDNPMKRATPGTQGGNKE